MRTYLKLTVILIAISCSSKRENINFELPKETKSSDLPFFPCRLKESLGSDKPYAVLIWKSEMISYAEVFKQFGYYGNGVSWEELCRTILKLENKKLIDEITFETSEAQTTMLVANKELQTSIAGILHKWATDKEKLREAFSEVNSIYME